MQTEIEAKFLGVDHDKLREKLKHLGAIRTQKMRLLRRKNFDFPDLRLQERGGWVRVRDEGDKTTLSYKQLNDRTVTGTKEVSLDVDSFEAACDLLDAIGLQEKSYQESKRESWQLEGGEIELDEWPWVEPYMEIEGKSIESIKKIATDLGFKWKDAVHGSVEVVYTAQYDVTEEEVIDWKKMLFSETPSWLKDKQK